MLYVQQPRASGRFVIHYIWFRTSISIAFYLWTRGERIGSIPHQEIHICCYQAFSSQLNPISQITCFLHAFRPIFCVQSDNDYI
jgi:hypothetical protein